MVWKFAPYRLGAPLGFLVPFAQRPSVQFLRADPARTQYHTGHGVLEVLTMEIIPRLLRFEGTINTRNLRKVALGQAHTRWTILKLV